MTLRVLRLSPVFVLVISLLLLAACGGTSVSAPGPNGNPSVSLAPASLTFDPQPVGNTVTKTFTVTNTGNATLTISGATLSSTTDFSFSAPAFPISISAGSSTTVSVSFKPTAEGSRTASLSISDNASGSPHSVSLSGTGTVPKISSSSSSVTFPETVPGVASAPMTVTISNPGSGSLTISNLQVSGVNASDFSFTAGTTPITVAPGSSTPVQLVFIPKESGMRAATLEVTSNVGSSPLNIGLSGAATDLTQDPEASISLDRNTGATGETFTVQIIGDKTTFVNGATSASFGPGISVQGATEGAFAPVTVVDADTATAQISITSLAAAGPRSIVVKTGTHESTATFTVTAPAGPIANAGSAQFVEAGDIVYLDGSASTGSPLTFLWSFESFPGSSAPPLSDPTTVNPSFTASEEGKYVLRLTVDGVSANSVAISTENAAPAANAGHDQFVSVGSTVTMDGSGSTSVDGDSLKYEWKILAKPASSTAALSNSSAVAPTFAADKAGAYEFELTVNDGHGKSSSDRVLISTQGTTPIASAGPRQTVPAGVSVQLNGSASVDPDGDSLTYEWEFTYLPQGSTASLINAQAINPSFTPDIAGTYALEIKVTDDDGNSSMATVVIDTLNSVPVANPGQPKNASTSETVELDGSGSSDADGDALTYSWNLLHKPAGSSATLTGANTDSPTFVADIPGEYVAQLVVKDSDHTSVPKTVLIRAAVPGLLVQPTLVLFGNQLVNTTSGSKSVVLNNTGNAPIMVSSIVRSGGNASDFAFTSAALPVTIPAGGSTTINATFTPSGTGTRSTNLVITSNAATSPHTVELRGMGTAPGFGASPSPLNFGSRMVGSPATLPLTISNTGTGPLTVTGITKTGPNAAEFVFSSSPLPFTIAAGANAIVDVTFTPATVGARTATLTFTHNANGGSSAISLTGTGALPAFSANPPSLSFSDQLVNTTSAAKSVTITNTGAANLVITNLGLSGTHAADYAFTGGTLPITVAPAASTTVNVTFTPKAAGTRTASLVVTNNAGGSPHSISLSGKGTAPVFATNPTSVAFGNQEIGTTSSQVALTINNTGDGPLTISSLSITGTNANRFTLIATGLPITVAPGGNTLLHFTFSPTTTGAHTASLNVTTNATGSPHVIALSGTGIVIPRLSLSVPSLTFGNQLIGVPSAAQAVTLTNSGTGTLSISGLAITGTHAANFSLGAPATPINLAAGASQQVNVTFTPSATGARTASLTITSNGTGSPHSVALSGTGIAPIFGVAPTSINFPAQQVSTTSAATNLTISNTGTGQMVISNLAISGTNAGDFTFTAGSLPITLQAGGNTVVGVRFAPTATGARAASLVITDTAAGSPHTVALTGTGTAPAFQIAPASVNFGDQLVGVQSAPTTITITNTGTANLIISGLTLTGSHPGEFGFTSGSALPITISAGNSTTIAVTFTPSTIGNRSASLSIADNAGGPHSVSLTGRGVTPGRLINPDPVAFGNQMVNTQSSPLAVTITNNGSANLVITNLAVSGTNAAEFTFTSGALPITVTPGNNTTVNVRFLPTAVGARAALLVITDNANGSPYSLSLTGTGTAPVIGLNPTSLAFSNQNVGTTSTSRTLTVNNTGTANLVITAINISGTHAAEYAFTSGTLPITIAPSSSANLGVTFSPTAAGARTASLNLTTNATGSPHGVALSGTGVAPGFSANPTSINFGNQNVGSTSAATGVVITNTGTGDLVISAISKSGTNSGDFAFTSGALPITVTPGNTTTVNVTFTPGATGARSASLNLTTNVIGSPHAIGLSGTGTAPGFSANPTNIPFGSQNVNSTSAQVPITISNPGNGVLTITALTVTGHTNDFVVSAGALPISVAAGGNTTVQVAFKPTTTGARAGTLSITTNAAGSPHSVSLSGTGTAPTAIVTPNSLGFGTQDVNTTSTPQVVNVSNTGNGNLIISSIAFSGGNTADFAFTSTTLPITVLPGGNAEINVTFSPKASGARASTLFITHNAAVLPSQVTVTGTGLAPVIELSPTAMNFGSLLVNTTSNSNLSIRNTGTSNLVVSALAITGTNAAEFTYSAAPPLTIAPGTVTQVPITFAPKQAGLRSATLNITSNSAGSPHTVTLTGMGTSNGTFTMPAVSVGKDLEVLATASVDAPAPAGGLTVTVSSSDPTKLLLSADPTVLGQGSINAVIPQGFNTIPLGFYVQGLVSSGSVQITVSAQGYVSATSTATFTPSGFVLGSPSGNFSTSTLSPDTGVSVLPVQLDTALNIIPGVTGRIRGGKSVNVTVTSSNTTVADILNGPSAFTGGNTSGSNLAFHPKAAGTAQIVVGVPTGFSQPNTGTSVTATVTQPNITLSPAVVGRNMQVTGAGFLQAAAGTGGLTITLTSADPSKVKLSTNPALEGTTSINVLVPQGSVLLPTYYVQGFDSTGTVNITASATGYATATGQVALAPSGFVIAGPSGTLGAGFSTTTLSVASNVRVTLMQLTAGLQPLAEGALRGGLSVTVPVTSGNTSVGTITDGPATFSAGSSTGIVKFQPVSAGTSTLSLGAPSIGGFTTPASGTQVVATVTNPGITLNLAANSIGSNLQTLGSGSLSAPAPNNGLTVTLTSNNPNVLVSSDTSGTTQGAQSVVVFVPGGSGFQGIGFPLFFVQALASSGTAQITASAPGWDSSTVTVNMTPSGLTLASFNGIAADFGLLLSQGNDAPLEVDSWQLDPVTLAPVRSQAIRGGLTVPVSVISGTPSVGMVLGGPDPNNPNTQPINGGSSGVVFTFRPTAIGTTLLQLTEPAGFSTPTVSGIPLTRLTGNVN